MIRIAICDDDEKFSEIFKTEVSRLFSKQGVENIIQTYSNPNNFKCKIRTVKYDIIFMDIDMPEITGIELASEIREAGSDAALVFVSNHDHFVFESFRYSAYRFIRKSNLIYDTSEMVSSYCRMIKKRPANMIFELEGKKNSVEDLSQIMYFYSIRHNILFYKSDKSSVRLAAHTYTMELLEKMLRDNGFIRIHKTYLLNFKWILRIENDNICLKDGDKLPLSRGRSEKVKKEYQRFLREGGTL